MIYRNQCLCLLTVLPAVRSASFTGTPHSSVIHLKGKAHLKRLNEHGVYPAKRSHDLTRHGPHVWHYSSPDVHTSKFTETRGRDPGIVSAEEREDEQGESVPVNSGVMPLFSQQSDGSGSPSAAATLDTVPASANTPIPSTITTESTSDVASSFQSQTRSNGQATQSQRASSALATASGSSSSSAFPPALLAFILVPVCIFLLGMAFALYRIYGKPGNRAPPASPMLLGGVTALGSGYHRDEAIALNDSTMQSRDSILGYDIDKRETIKWEPRLERNASTSGARITRGGVRDPHGPHLLMPPFRTHSAETYNSSPSRVLRPHVSRPYNCPHPAFTADPESAIPLILNSGKYRTYKNGKDGYTTSNPKGKGKENVLHEKGHRARKHRDDISTTPLNTSPRSLPFRDPVISTGPSDIDIRFQTRTQRSPSSLVSMTKNKNQPHVPSQSSTSTSFDIGLAMLTDFSSPKVGLGFDLSPCLPSLEHNSTGKISHTDENLVNGSIRQTSRDSSMPYLEYSVTAGSRGLAYLSGSSQETMFTSKQFEAEPVENELDIASALAVYRTQHIDDCLKAQKAPVDRMSETQHSETQSQESSTSTEARYTPSDIKAPTLPTLSEMALSRADPLYESVTNELFSTYGMRMSIVNGAGQKSRVSARISRMLSWFAGADSSNTGSRLSGVENRMSCEDSKSSGEGPRERLSNMSSAGVQPLRIGKVRKNAA